MSVRTTPVLSEEEQSELKRLLKEKFQPKIGTETLRKAAVYFAKETMR